MSAAAAASTSAPAKEGAVGDRVEIHYLQGVAPNGTPAYSNGDDEFKGRAPEISKSGHFATGFRWQCVEFARRWLWDAKGLILPSIPFAAHIFYLGYVFDPALNRNVPTKSTRNGTTSPPEADSLIIYSQCTENFVGHVGVIVEATETYIRVADQNRFFHHWEGKSYSKEFPVEKRADGTYWIIDHEARPLGWVTVPGYPTVHHDTPLSAPPRGDGPEPIVTRPFPAHVAAPPDPQGRGSMLRLMGCGIRSFHPHPVYFFWFFARLILFVIRTAITKGFKFRFSGQFQDHSEKHEQQQQEEAAGQEKAKTD